MRNMITTIGQVTKEKFHNFVVYCLALDGVSSEDRQELELADKMTATCLLALFKEQLTPAVMKSVKQRQLSEVALLPAGLRLETEHVEKICAYIELFHMLATQE